MSSLELLSQETNQTCHFEKKQLRSLFSGIRQKENITIKTKNLFCESSWWLLQKQNQCAAFILKALGCSAPVPSTLPVLYYQSKLYMDTCPHSCLSLDGIPCCAWNTSRCAWKDGTLCMKYSSVSLSSIVSHLTSKSDLNIYSVAEKLFQITAKTTQSV